MGQTRFASVVLVIGLGCGCDGAPDPIQFRTGAPLITGSRLLAPVVTGQSAELTLNGFAFPAGVASNGHRLLVADVKHNRVVAWQRWPSAPRPADLALGQHSLGALASGYDDDPAVPCAFKCNAVAAGGDRVVVGDRHGNRVLVWNQSPGESGVAPDLTMPVDNPRGLWTDGASLVVISGSTLLVWHRFPYCINERPDATVVGALAPVDADYGAASGIAFDGAHLYVSDTGQNRVLAWNGLPMDGAPPDFVFGGPDDAEGVGPSSLAGPKGLAVAAGSLFVADSGHHRVLVFTPAPDGPGAVAQAVLGQDSLTASQQWRELPKYDQRAVQWPEGLAVAGSFLYVADSYEGAYRVLGFRLH